MGIKGSVLGNEYWQQLFTMSLISFFLFFLNPGQHNKLCALAIHFVTPKWLSCSFSNLQHVFGNHNSLSTEKALCCADNIPSSQNSRRCSGTLLQPYLCEDFSCFLCQCPCSELIWFDLFFGALARKCLKMLYIFILIILPFKRIFINMKDSKHIKI